MLQISYNKIQQHAKTFLCSNAANSISQLSQFCGKIPAQ